MPSTRCCLYNCVCSTASRFHAIDATASDRWRGGSKVAQRLVPHGQEAARQKMISTQIRTCDRLSSTDGDQATRGSSVTERSSDPPRTRDGSDPSGGHFSSANRLAKYAVACVEIKILRRVRAESSRRPPRHRRGACSMAWRCRFLTARPSQDGRVIAEK